MSNVEPGPEDVVFDQQFADLSVIDPPELLEARTLSTWRAERARSAFRTRALSLAGMAAIAAMAVLAAREPPVVGSPASMVERGTGVQLPSVNLKVSVRAIDGSVERFATNRRYAAGDTLMFRVTAQSVATLVLRREAQVLWSGNLPAGEHDLPIAYALEAGQGPARFVLEGGTEPVTLYLPAVGAQ